MQEFPTRNLLNFNLDSGILCFEHNNKIVFQNDQTTEQFPANYIHVSVRTLDRSFPINLPSPNKLIHSH